MDKNIVSLPAAGKYLLPGALSGTASQDLFFEHEQVDIFFNIPFRFRKDFLMSRKFRSIVKTANCKFRIVGRILLRYFETTCMGFRNRDSLDLRKTSFSS